MDMIYEVVEKKSLVGTVYDLRNLDGSVVKTYDGILSLSRRIGLDRDRIKEKLNGRDRFKVNLP